MGKTDELLFRRGTLLEPRVLNLGRVILSSPCCFLSLSLSLSFLTPSRGTRGDWNRDRREPLSPSLSSRHLEIDASTFSLVETHCLAFLSLSLFLFLCFFFLLS